MILHTTFAAARAAARAADAAAYAAYAAYAAEVKWQEDRFRQYLTHGIAAAEMECDGWRPTIAATEAAVR